MKPFQIQRLMAVALVACLPIACGSNSPASPDAVTTASALRIRPSTPGMPRVTVPPPQECRAVAAEIRIVRGSLPDPQYAAESVLLQITMLGKDGGEITDGSCQGVVWSFETGYAAGAILTVTPDTLFASVTGQPGRYAIRATTPNSQTATVGITLR